MSARAHAPRCVLGLLWLASGCSGSHAMVPPQPAPVPFKADLASLTVALQALQVHAPDAPPSAAVAETLRSALAAYLRGYVNFHAVIEDADAAASPGETMLRLDVAIEAVTTLTPDAPRHGGIGAVGNPFAAMAPDWGEVAVRVVGTLSDARGRAVWRGEESGHADYERVMFKGYRGRSAEAAYSAAYGEAFGRFATLMGAARPTLLAAVQPAAATPLATDSRGPGEKIAVMATRFDEAAGVKLPNVFDDCVLSAVQQASGAETMGQDDINALLTYERQKDLLGCDDASCVAAVAGALGADLVVTVKVARLAPDWAVSAKIINVRDPRVEARIAEFAAGDVEALMRGMPAMLQKLFAQRRR